MSKHYSVRKSVQYPGKYKIVLAGGWNGYVDIDLPMFESFSEAIEAAEKLEKLRKAAA